MRVAFIVGLIVGCALTVGAGAVAGWWWWIHRPSSAVCSNLAGTCRSLVRARCAQACRQGDAACDQACTACNHSCDMGRELCITQLEIFWSPALEAGFYVGCKLMAAAGDAAVCAPVCLTVCEGEAACRSGLDDGSLSLPDGLVRSGFRSQVPPTVMDVR